MLLLSGTHQAAAAGLVLRATNEQRTNPMEERFWRQNNSCRANCRIRGRLLGNVVEDPKVSHFAENTHRIGAGTWPENAKNFSKQRHTKCTERTRPFFFHRTNDDGVRVSTNKMLLRWRRRGGPGKCHLTAELRLQVRGNVLGTPNARV